MAVTLKGKLNETKYYILYTVFFIYWHGSKNYSEQQPGRKILSGKTLH